MSLGEAGWCRGVICLVEVVDGRVHKGDRLTGIATGDSYDVTEVRYAFLRRAHARSWRDCVQQLSNTPRSLPIRLRFARRAKDVGFAVAMQLNMLNFATFFVFFFRIRHVLASKLPTSTRSICYWHFVGL